MEHLRERKDTRKLLKMLDLIPPQSDWQAHGVCAPEYPSIETISSDI